MAPNKKYLSLEEAAEQLGIKTDELIRLREKGEIRGFADRGTWKFKGDDVVEYRRRHQADSDPDLPIMDEDDDLGRQATVIRRGKDSASDSDVKVASAADSSKSKLSGSSDEIGIVHGDSSDSDVRLIDAPLSLKPDSDSDVKLVKPKPRSASDSDSDVKIVGLSDKAPESDSDVKLLEPLSPLTDSDSDVKLAASDSDVRLAPLIDSDSDVKLIDRKSSTLKSDSDSDVALLPRGAMGDINAKTIDLADPDLGGGALDFDLSDDQGGSVLLDADESALDLSHDSGIQLAGDSGIRLAGASGIKLKPDSDIRLAGDSGATLKGDSGIRLAGLSGIRLSDDSGVQLKQPADSGISLEGHNSGIDLGEDSGINLMPSSGSLKAKSSSKNLLGGSSNKLKGDSSAKKLKGDSSAKKMKGAPKVEMDDLEATSPLLLSGLEDDDDFSGTSPLLAATDDSDEPDLANLDMLEGTDTLEVPTDESEPNVVMFDDDAEDESPVPSRKKQKKVEDSIFEMDEAADQELDELEVSDDDLSDDGGIDDLAFDEDSDDHDESFSEGSSQIVRGGPQQRIPVVQEVEWTAGTCALLFASLCFLIFGSLVSADLLRIVWNQGVDPNDALSQPWWNFLASLWK